MNLLASQKVLGLKRRDPKTQIAFWVKDERCGTMYMKHATVAIPVAPTQDSLAQGCARSVEQLSH